MGDVFSASESLVKALVGSLYILSYAAQSIITKVAAVVHKHSSRYLPSPRLPPKSISRIEKAAGRLGGRQATTPKLLIRAHHLRDMALLEREDVLLLRAVTLITIGTLCALRFSEVKCDDHAVALPVRHSMKDGTRSV
jgi:hypothetical protein